ncbi:MAG TPA: hypothetical protein VE258_03570, partial [Ktedonobacterales bacterium]|nr:hypothetical protein [Ktedonobacterales bacterium]
MDATDIPQCELPRVAALAASEAQAAPALQTELQVVSTARDFCALANEWQQLHAQARTTSLFNTWTWHFAWWEQHGSPGGLKILVARRAGVASGIVPLHVAKGGVLGWGLRVLQLLGTQGERNPYNIAPLFERGAESATARVLAQALLAMRGYDVLRLADTDASVPLATALAHASEA